MVTDLVTQLTEAATAAIANERASLESPVGHVRGVTIELTLSGAGQIHEAICFIERRTAAGALLGRHIKREPALPAEWGT
jgi:hypothetical protein